MKRTLVLLMVCILALGSMSMVLTGCGSQSKDTTSGTAAVKDTVQNTENTGSASTAADKKPSANPQFTIWMGTDEKKCPEVTEVQKLLKEKLGFDFKVQSRQGDLMTALNLKLNSGGFEDMAVIYKDEVAVKAFVKSGQIQEVDQYLKMPDKYPNLAKIPQQVTDFCRSTDGKLWYIPGAYDQNLNDPWPGWAASAWWPRTDLVEKVGMKVEDLSTMDGLEKYLREVSKLKDDSGKPIIPLGLMINEGNTLNNEESIILSTFGVDMAGGASKMPGVRKNGDSFMFAYDHPGFKNAYAWMNKMYREGLMDVEIPTQKVERYREKVNAGRYGMLAGSMWKAELNNSWAKLSGPTSTTWYLKPVKNPSVAGVSSSGAVQYTNPYPGACIFISKKTKNLDSILKFMDWCQEADPIRGQEINEGPYGINWSWTGEPFKEWKFEDNYAKERNSGDQARVDKMTPQLWMLGTSSKKWYAWWTYAIGPNDPVGMKFASTYTAEIANNFGIVRTMHAYDAVPALAGGVIEKYLPTLNAVYIENRAKMIMSRSEAEFENNYKKFREQLEKRAHWSEMKAEWNQQYKEYLKTHNDF